MKSAQEKKEKEKKHTTKERKLKLANNDLTQEHETR